MDHSNGVFTLVFLIGIGAFIFFYDSSFVHSLLYSFKYNVAFGDVYTDAKPEDCNFMLAPMGFKGCSYMARVRVFNAEGEWVTGDNPPIYGNDPQTGNPLISYDNGKAVAH